MLLLIVAPLILVSIVHPVRLVGINADGLMLLLIVAPPTPTSIVIPLGPTGIGIDPPVFTHADFVCNAANSILGACDVRPLVTDPGWATRAGIGCGRYI
jgi:hypothetical protein